MFRFLFRLMAMIALAIAVVMAVLDADQSLALLGALAVVLNGACWERSAERERRFAIPARAPRRCGTRAEGVAARLRPH